MKTTRKRVRDNRTATNHVYTWSATYPPYSGIEYRGPNYTGSYEEILDNNNRGFRKIRKSGGIVLSDCLVSRFSRAYTPGHTEAKNPTSNYSGSMNGDMALLIKGGAPTPTSEVTAANAMVLLMKAFAKINSSAIMSGEAVSDLNTTISMLRHPFKSSRDLLYKMGKYRSARLGKTTASAAKATANAWLEYRYGWKPLMMDAETIMHTALVRRRACDRLRLVARAGDKNSGKFSVSWPATAAVSCKGSHSESTKITCDVGVLYDVKSRTTAEEVAAYMGTRPSDMPATIWEAIPYSFVVDWFVNVGDWLQAITPVPGINIQGWWVTTTSNRTATTAGEISYFNPSAAINNWNGSYGSETINSFSYARVCNQPLDFHPTLTAKALSMLHQADAMALLVKPILGSLRSFRH